jgi:hypothetical protein
MKCHQLFGHDIFPPDPNQMFLQKHGFIYFFTHTSISAAISSNKYAQKIAEKFCMENRHFSFQAGL